MRCPACQSDNPADNAFCGGCGSPLALLPAAAAAPEAERRQLTVMFCDLVDSTALSGHLDPEELRAVVRAYQEVCTEPIVRQFDGYVAQYLGDGLLVYFGYPRAHEDDPVRGVSAALAVLAELPRLSEALRDRLPAGRDALYVRIAVHTGLVVVGDMGGGARRERLALGETVNVASRLLGACGPGEVVISDATRSLVRGVFVLNDLGPQTLRGVREPVRVHRVVRRSGVTSRFDQAAAAGLTPLVGRTQETAALLDRWEQASEGSGRVVLVCGEAGMGKSRLMRTLRERLQETPHSWLEAHCSAYHSNSAFYPVIELLERALLLERRDPVEVKLAKLDRAIRNAGYAGPDALAVLASLLSIPLAADRPAPDLDPELQRTQTLDLLEAWLISLTLAQPMVLVIEDLHWVDPSTLELLRRLVDRAPAARLLLLATSRPGIETPWPPSSHTVHLTLTPLAPDQIAELVEGVTRGRLLPTEILDEIVAKTDGVPLFVEELTRMVLESGLVTPRDRDYALAGPLRPLAIPATLRDSLMARLDRLGLSRELAQLGAVLGREFSYELFAAVTALDARTLDTALDSMVDAELLYARGKRPEATYSFRHAMIRDTAYESLLKDARRRHHERIARVLREDETGRFDSDPELLAYHYEEAGLPEPAIEHYAQAGERGLARSAYKEARAHLERAIELLRTRPEERVRNERELELLVTLGPATQATDGFASEAAESLWKRAQVLSEKLPEAPQRGAVLSGLANVYLTRGDLAAASEAAGRLRRYGEESGDEGAVLRGHMGGVLDLFRGRFEASLEHWERVLTLYSAEKHARLIRSYGTDAGVLARSYASWALWLVGRGDASLEQSRAALAHARSLAHPLSEGQAIALAVGLSTMRRDREGAADLAEECIAISERYGFPVYRSMGLMARCWATEPGPERLALMDEALSAAGGTGNQMGAPLVLAGIVEVYREAGRGADALRFADAALALSRSRSQSFWDAEIHRLKGDLALDADDVAGAEQAFREAIETARTQGAHSLELRASTSLARLWQDQGRTDDARDLLAPVYARFHEGFDTADLQAARAFL